MSMVISVPELYDVKNQQNIRPVRDVYGLMVEAKIEQTKVEYASAGVDASFILDVGPPPPRVVTLRQLASGMDVIGIDFGKCPSIDRMINAGMLVDFSTSFNAGIEITFRQADSADVHIVEDQQITDIVQLDYSSGVPPVNYWLGFSVSFTQPYKVGNVDTTNPLFDLWADDLVFFLI